MKGRTYRYFNDALFPFGYGLSYTSFEIGAPTSAVDGNSVAITVPVKNTGKCDGTEIVQVYIRNTADKEGPLKTLRAFKRIDVKAGQKVTDTIRLDRESFEGWDSETNTMRFVPGTYEIFVGNSSLDEDLQRLPVTIQ
jgi:beta-glucosidase